MPHFYIKPENIKNKTFTIIGDDTYHLIKVRRCKEGEMLDLFDGTGKCYSGKIEKIGKSIITGTITEEKTATPSKISINLYTAIPKGERTDWLIEKSSELGIKKVIPVIIERSVAKDVSDSKVKRWERISLSASEQSNRADIMQVDKPLSFTNAVKNISKEALSIIPWVSEDSKTIEDALLGRESNEINIFIGPEGGFTNQEIEKAKDKGIIPVTLGRRILRVETAGLLSSILVMGIAGEYK